MDLPNFEKLREMAEKSPAELDKLQQTLTEKVITGAPEDIQHRLRGLQFRVEMEKSLSKTPLARCLKLSQMMHESFDQLRSLLNDMTTADSYQATPTTAADIIPFPTR